MLILNTGISHNSKDLLMFNYWNWEDKERAKLREEMLVQFKLEHDSVIGS
jgi:hypothetical protein